MALITNILFPVDFSESCIAMAPYVKRAAAMWRAKVSLVHVYDPNSYNGFEIFQRRTEDIAEEHEEVARNKLNELLAAEFPVSEHARILTSGRAASEIARIARDGFDLIIMPTHAGSFRRMLLGSTAAKVLDDADCPVLTSHHAETITPRQLEHREWLCAIDLSEDSERLLRYANRGAAETGSKLHIVHAIQAGDSDLAAPPDPAEKMHSAEIERAARRIAALQEKIGSDAPVQIAFGSVKEALLEAVRRYDADVLMIGRGPHSGTHGRLRDLTYAVVRDSPFPVLST